MLYNFCWISKCVYQGNQRFSTGPTQLYRLECVAITLDQEKASLARLSSGCFDHSSRARRTQHIVRGTTLLRHVHEVECHARRGPPRLRNQAAQPPRIHRAMRDRATTQRRENRTSKTEKASTPRCGSASRKQARGTRIACEWLKWLPTLGAANRKPGIMVATEKR